MSSPEPRYSVRSVAAFFGQHRFFSSLRAMFGVNNASYVAACIILVAVKNRKWDVEFDTLVALPARQELDKQDYIKKHNQHIKEFQGACDYRRTLRATMGIHGLFFSPPSVMHDPIAPTRLLFLAEGYHEQALESGLRILIDKKDKKGKVFVRVITRDDGCRHIVLEDAFRECLLAVIQEKKPSQG